jgi:hypothetical protein
MAIVLYCRGRDELYTSVSEFGGGQTRQEQHAERLHTNAGWDNVTGVGTPNAKAFADFFFGK